MARLRFETFELDMGTGELFKNSRRLRLQDQPARLLMLLAGRPGELVTRTEIQESLWGRDQFVEFEHAINTAVRKIRETLEDDPENPRIIETLPRKGYRFIAKIDEMPQTDLPMKPEPAAQSPGPAVTGAEVFALPQNPARRLFLFIQFGYLLMYSGTLYYVSRLEQALGDAGFVPVSFTFPLTLVVAMCGIAVRLYLISAVGWKHPAAGIKFRRLFPVLLILDGLWAAAPLLAANAISTGIALVGVAGLAYLPFSQRTLMLSIYPDSFIDRA